MPHDVHGHAPRTGWLSAYLYGDREVTESNLKAAVLELRKVFAEHLPADDVPGIPRKAVENALAEVPGDTPKRPGRPPRSATAVMTTPSPKRKGRSPASRRKQAEKMRAYWKAKKAAEAASKRKRGRPAKAAGAAPEATTAGM